MRPFAIPNLHIARPIGSAKLTTTDVETGEVAVPLDRHNICVDN